MGDRALCDVVDAFCFGTGPHALRARSADGARCCLRVLNDKNSNPRDAEFLADAFRGRGMRERHRLSEQALGCRVLTCDARECAEAAAAILERPAAAWDWCPRGFATGPAAVLASALARCSAADAGALASGAGRAAAALVAIRKALAARVGRRAFAAAANGLWIATAEAAIARATLRAAGRCHASAMERDFAFLETVCRPGTRPVGTPPEKPAEEKILDVECSGADAAQRVKHSVVLLTADAGAAP